MNRSRISIVAFCMVIAANLALLYWLRGRRDKVRMPTNVRQWQESWQPIAERTSDDRRRLVATAFALNNFQVTPLTAEGDSVTIPRPERWREQMIIETTYVDAVPNEDGSMEATGDSTSTTTRVSITSVALSGYSTVLTPGSAFSLVKERVIHRDVYMAKNGIEVPVLELASASRYYISRDDDSLVQTQSAIQVNGKASMNYSATVPHWLLPKRKLVVGETWEQIGVHAVGVPNTAPRPRIERKLNRLVMFDRRRAAEVSSTGTYFDYAPGPSETHVERIEMSLMYVDLETGEPLWFEAKSDGERGFTSLVRGCNQIFTKHLLRVPRK